MRSLSTLLCLLLLVSLVPGAHADAPQTMSYQGILTDNAGTPVPNGSYSLTFSLYDVAADGAPLWTETQAAVTVQAGLVSVQLGAVAPLTLAFDVPYFLGISVNGGAEMAPRVPLASSPYGLSLRLPFSGTASSATEALHITNTGGGAAIVSDPLLDARGSLSVTGAGGTILLLGDNVGDASVALPVDAISSLEERDEPGVASATSDVLVSFSSGYKTLLSRTITVPSDGYVLAMAAGTQFVFHNPGTTDNAEFGVSTVPTSLPANQDQDVSIASSMPSNFYTASYSPHGLFAVTAGAHTFYFLGHYLSGGGEYATNLQLTLAYFPTAYGTVTPTVAQTATKPALDLTRTGPEWDVEAERREGEAFARDRVERELSEMHQRLATLEAALHVPTAKRAPAAGAR